MKVTELFAVENTRGKQIPMFTMSVAAGQPMTVDDNVDEYVDINEFLIQHPATTFFAKVEGESLTNLGISSNDIVIFDSSLEPKDGKLVLVEYNNEISIKMYRIINGNAYIQSDDNSFMPLNFEPLMNLKIIGVVTKVIHSV